jgi:dihydrofolate reductase
VAVDDNGGIGKENQVPWKLPDDLKNFKLVTMGHHLIMGRKTYQSIGRPLPGRTSIIITRQNEYKAHLAGQANLLIAHSLDEAIQLADSKGENEVFIIGGGEIYALALPLADKMYLSQVHGNFACDTSFPIFDINKWEIREQKYHPADEKHACPYTYSVLVKG